LKYLKGGLKCFTRRRYEETDEFTTNYSLQF